MEQLITWLDWKTEFQKLMYEADLKTEYIKSVSDDWWKGYFFELFEKQMTPKEAFKEYLETATEEAP